MNSPSRVLFSVGHWLLILLVAAIAAFVVGWLWVGGLPEAPSPWPPEPERPWTQYELQLEDADALMLEREHAALQARKDRGDWSDRRQARLETLEAMLEARRQQFRAELDHYASQALRKARARLHEARHHGDVYLADRPGRITARLPEATARTTLDLLCGSGQMQLCMEADRNDAQLAGLTFPDNPNPRRYRWVPLHEAEIIEFIYEPWCEADGRHWFLLDTNPPGWPRFTGADIREVRVDRTPAGEPALGFEFTQLRDRFAEMTSDYRYYLYEDAGKQPLRLCVVYNEEVVFAGQINSEIRGRVLVAFAAPEWDLERMVTCLRASPMPGRLVPVGVTGDD